MNERQSLRAMRTCGCPSAASNDQGVDRAVCEWLREDLHSGGTTDRPPDPRHDLQSKAAAGISRLASSNVVIGPAARLPGS